VRHNETPGNEVKCEQNNQRLTFQESSKMDDVEDFFRWLEFPRSTF